MIKNGNKTCSKCKQEKPISDFFESEQSTDGLQNWCKICARMYKNRWNKSNAEKRRNYKLKYKYGITEERYHKLLQIQNYRCSICKRHQEKLRIRLSVDHNHKTGEIRGLLCSDCNPGLGYFKDNITLLKRAIKYLTK